MIVKRVTAALRRQDWTAVAIEFLLVVLGVLLAFQINEWATEREAAHERDAATERLLAEAEETVAYMRLGVSGHQKIVNELHFALGAIERGDWRIADKARTTMAFYRAGDVAPLAPPSAVYDDLVSSGALGKIGNAHLRSTIAKYRATLSFSSQHTDYVLAELPDLEDAPAFRYSFDPDEPRRLQLDVDYDALRNDELLREKLAMLVRLQRQVLTMRKRLLKDATRMCVELGRFVGKPCNLHLPPPKFD